MKEFKRLNDIDDKKDEGKLLIAALGQLSCKPGFTDKTPDEILEEIAKIAKMIYAVK